MKVARGTAPPRTFIKDLLIKLALGVGFLGAIFPRHLEESKEDSSDSLGASRNPLLGFGCGFGCALLCFALLCLALFSFA